MGAEKGTRKKADFHRFSSQLGPQNPAQTEGETRQNEHFISDAFTACIFIDFRRIFGPKWAPCTVSKSTFFGSRTVLDAFLARLHVRASPKLPWSPQNADFEVNFRTPKGSQNLV